MRDSQLFKHICQPCAKPVNAFNWQIFVSSVIEKKIQIRFHTFFGIIVANKHGQKRQWLDHQGDVSIVMIFNGFPVEKFNDILEKRGV